MNEVLHNSNGQNYKVLDKFNYMGADVDYYKDSWQKFAYALLQNEGTKEYVVASAVGETSWGSGNYYGEEQKERAKEDYLDKVYSYKKYMLG